MELLAAHLTTPVFSSTMSSSLKLIQSHPVETTDSQGQGELTSVISVRPISTWLLERGGRCIHTDIHTMLLGRGRSHREHSRPVLEGAGEARDPCVVRQAGVTIARRQRRVQEGLLRGVVSLSLVLLGLGQGCGRGWGGGIPTAKLCEVTRIRVAGQATIPPSQRSGGRGKWDAVVIQGKSCLKHL